MNSSRIVRLALLLGLPLQVLADPIYNNNQVVNVLPAPYASPSQDVPPLPPLPPQAAPAPAERIARVAIPVDPVDDPHQRGLSLGGPRFGISYVTGAGFDKIRDAVKKARPDVELEQAMTQFGWQVEYRMFRTSKGVTALTEFIPLVGGMDLGLALPSATWLVGLRSKKGFEVGVGPNFGLDGVAMMAGGGYTFDLGGINVPVNFAFGKGANQTNSFALSTGFNL
jgi:hypothetical protein